MNVRTMKLIYYIALYSILFVIINGDHFLGGTITWRPLNASATGSPIPIVIIQTYSWSYHRIACTQTMIANNAYVPSYAQLSSQILACIYNCGNYSSGYPNISVIPRCTDFSRTAGTTVGQRLDTVYLDVNDDFAVAFRDYAWRPLATHTNALWSISTRIIIKLRSDTGLYNNAPVATVMSPINIPFNRTISIHIPIADIDNDILRCRWSINASGINECGGVCPTASLPPNTLIYPNCTIIINGRNLSDWYAVTVMIEDFIDSSRTIPLSSVPVQFLVQVISASACPTQPEIIGLPIKESCIPIVVGKTFTSELIAQNNCGTNVSIDDIATLSFSGMITGNITQRDSMIYYKTMNWTPTSSQLGYQVMCAMAIDSESVQSAQYCFKFYVTQNEVCGCPGETCGRTVINSSSSTQPITWIVIGIIISLFLSAISTWCCFCLYRYFCAAPFYGSSRQTVRLYHIERCMNPKCYNIFSSSHTNLQSQSFQSSQIMNLSSISDKRQKENKKYEGIYIQYVPRNKKTLVQKFK